MPPISRLEIKKIITDTAEMSHPILAYIIYVIEVSKKKLRFAKLNHHSRKSVNEKVLLLCMFIKCERIVKNKFV